MRNSINNKVKWKLNIWDFFEWDFRIKNYLITLINPKTIKWYINVKKILI